jgi:hypothetical protein
MKTRLGFVSNSSSASFIVDWKCKLNDGNKIGFALHKLFDYWDLKYDETTDQISVDERFGKEYALIEESKEDQKSPCADCETKCEDQKSSVPDMPNIPPPPPKKENIFLDLLEKIRRENPPEPVYEKGSTKEKMQFVDHIRKNTIAGADGRFQTRFFTCMLNDYEDFGDDPQRLIFALAMQAGRCGNRDFEIVRTELVSDN